MASFAAFSVGSSSFLSSGVAQLQQSRQNTSSSRVQPVTMMVKRWVKQEMTENGKPVRVKMHVRKGDTVQVIAGADKGKVSEVEEVYTKTGKILVKDVNIKTKHVKPRSQEEAGQITEMSAPIAHSNVMLYSKEKETRSRVGYRVEDGKKVRYLVKTGSVML
ncbi:hypothetical protein CYMTET_19306 [Cymbomonas tetramitiformis]|uniref:KOW domain-containing protein n=1 Tax=Cymbomonas tetramitiformis TaxID=36881 RepID=A0AAE0G6H1_9CHLO|nr:hypothetical protein CYMTET_19306 [Cymbomonas tetramitiformis]